LLFMCCYYKNHVLQWISTFVVTTACMLRCYICIVVANVWLYAANVVWVLIRINVIRRGFRPNLSRRSIDSRNTRLDQDPIVQI
jgi:hypothetical protein